MLKKIGQNLELWAIQRTEKSQQEDVLTIPKIRNKTKKAE